MFGPGTTDPEIPEFDDELAGPQVGMFGGLADHELEAELRTIHRRRSEDEAREVAVLAEMEQRRRTERSRHRDTAAQLRYATGIARSTAAGRAKVARRLAPLPVALSALGAGMITWDHARALADAGDRHPDALTADEWHLTVLAMEQTADTFRQTIAEWIRALDEQVDRRRTPHERQRARRTYRRWRDRDGMQAGTFRFDDETAAMVDAAMERVYRERLRAERDLGPDAVCPDSYEQRMADAFAEVVRRSDGADAMTKHRAVPTIIATTTIENLRGQLGTEGRCELADGTPLTAAQVRRMACEADVMLAVLGEDGRPLDLGRSVRTASIEQRLGLRTEYHTCAGEGCTVPFDWCEIHHIIPWEEGGMTDIENLIPLCQYHHHLLHAGIWPVAIRGRSVHFLPPPPARPDRVTRARCHRAQMDAHAPPPRYARC